MCGILLQLSREQGHVSQFTERLLKLRHRGPDSLGVLQETMTYGDEVFHLLVGHSRLAIIDPESGTQPFKHNKITLAVNGEIFNYKDIKREYADFAYKTESDCEVLIPLFERHGVTKGVRYINGQFGLIYINTEGVFVARDPIGIIQLYVGYKNGDIFVASEMKAIQDCDSIQHVEPGSCMNLITRQLFKYYNIHAINQCSALLPPNLDHLRKLLVESVKLRMMSDVPWGIFLSGGLDSSLVASIASRLSPTKVRTFSVGLQGSPDLLAAKRVAKHIGSDHTEVIYSVNDLIAAVKGVVYHLETYDITTIRASVPMTLLSQVIAESGIKMCLSGEGADELFGGYIYFKYAPTPHEFQLETLRLLSELGHYDCLRADKSTMASSLEVRPPFLDPNLIEYVVKINPSYKMHTRIEKEILRNAFDDPESPWLPPDVLWRQKEAFSDGVGYSWVTELKKVAEKDVSDEVFDRYKENYGCESREEVYLRSIYHSIFTDRHDELTPHIWRPRWTDVRDPSATHLDVHECNRVGN